ncbi:hypothetical protein CEXT_16521 [Caerostris extrusa]|uniref:Uncharacterized protein n=1 Tax=Caerostris extrusa TaxID=172846 RepID=A0AAV4RKY3_CAEEX|nr:hypothetical protein CEXT_16521 [Caerostris extrusa]
MMMVMNMVRRSFSSLFRLYLSKSGIASTTQSSPADKHFPCDVPNSRNEWWRTTLHRRALNGKKKRNGNSFNHSLYDHVARRNDAQDTKDMTRRDEILQECDIIDGMLSGR